MVTPRDPWERGPAGEDSVVVRNQVGAVVAGLSVAPTAIGAEVIFTLSADASVSCEVLNIAGRSVRTVVADRQLAGGMNSLAWDGRNAGGCAAPSGTYLVRVTAASSDGSASQSIGTVVLRR